MTPRFSRLRWLAVATAAVGLVMSTACDDSEDEDAPNDNSVTVTIGSDSLDVPAELTAGVISVEVIGGGEDVELDFTRVAEGTTEEEFIAAIRSASQGDAIPDLLVATSGVMTAGGTQSILLGPGPHFVWAEIYPDDPEAESILLVQPVEVSGSMDEELPKTSGTITAFDYGFKVDVEAGETFTFRNDGPNQLHHAVLIDFGELDPTVVRDNLPAFFAAEEGEAPPPAFADFDFDNAFIGSTAVTSNGLGGTFSANVESGHSYAVVCFIQDRQGGPPHAFAYNMFDVFTVE